MDRAQFDIFLAQAAAWLVAAVPNLIAAIIILIVGILVSGWVSRLVLGVLQGRPQIDGTLVPVIVGLLRYLILIVTLVAVLGQLGVQIASILAVIGAAGLAVGLALQGTLSNIAAGLMLLWLRPFRTGETIQVDGEVSKVVEIGLFASHLVSPDGLFRFVPNSQLWNKPVTNFSRNPTRRVDLTVGIDYGDDVDAAKNLLLDLARQDARVLQNPEPTVVVSALADSSVNLSLMAWTSSADFGAVKSDLTQGAKQALEAGGLSIPFPQSVVHHKNDPTDQGANAVEPSYASRNASEDR